MQAAERPSFSDLIIRIERMRLEVCSVTVVCRLVVTAALDAGTSSSGPTIAVGGTKTSK